MVIRQWQHHITYCRQDPHKAWLSDSGHITLHTVDKTRTRHGHQTVVTLHYITYCQQDPHEAWSSDSGHITLHTVDKTRTKHGRQTVTTSHYILLTRPTQSMVFRQWPHYITYYRLDTHKAWSSDSGNITLHTVDKTHTKHGHQTVVTLHYILSTRPTQSMVIRQWQHHITYCQQASKNSIYNTFNIYACVVTKSYYINNTLYIHSCFILNILLANSLQIPSYGKLLHNICFWINLLRRTTHYMED